MSNAVLPASIAEVTPEWLTEVLCDGDARVRSHEWQVLGEGVGFIGQLGRIELAYSGDRGEAPATLVAKFPSPIVQNRGFGMVAGLYETEIRFYTELAPTLGVRVPRCYFGAFDPEPASSRAVAWMMKRLPPGVTMAMLGPLTAAAARSRRRFALLIEDLSHQRMGDQVAGCKLEEARAALGALARVHARMWNSPELDQPWLRAIDEDTPVVYGLFRRTWSTFVERYRPYIDNVEEVGSWLHRNGEAILHRLSHPPRTLLHGDYRLDNLFFDPTIEGPDGVTIIDWQGIRVGNPLSDVAYFIRPNISPEHAEDSEEPLLREYHDALLREGVRDYRWEDCQRDYRLAQAWLAMQGAFLLGALDLSHERGVELLDRAVQRSGPSLSRIDFSTLEV